jgi:hypothetical protein
VQRRTLAKSTIRDLIYSLELEAMKSIRLLALASLIALTSVATGIGETLPGIVGDANTSVYYVASTGEFGIQPDGWNIQIFLIQSTTGIFIANAVFPSGTLFDVNTATEKGWAGTGASAIRKDFSLGVIAASGMALDFLLKNLTLAGPSCGCSTPILDLVYYAPGNLPPRGLDEVVNFPTAGPGITFTHKLTAIDTEDQASALVWSDVQLRLDGRGDPLFQPTLSSLGIFSWDTTGSPRGSYTASAIVTDSVGHKDMVVLTINTIPEPTAFCLCGLAMICVGRRGPRRR